MIWAVPVSVAVAAAVAASLKWYVFAPKVPVELIADADLELVRDEDRAAWRNVRQSAYRGWKRQDDFYRVAAYRKAIASGMSPPDAKAAVRRDFPFYYLDPETRDDDSYVGEDAGLPIVLRERVNARAHLLKPVMADMSGEFRTMNALVRQFIRKGAL